MEAGGATGHPESDVNVLPFVATLEVDSHR
jgi:hypothetical protein